MSYRKIIDRDSGNSWEKELFHATYKEFLMQAQEYDRENRYETFDEMLQYILRAKDMHYLVSTAAINILRQLQDVIPDVVDNHGQTFLRFKNFKFELLKSHKKDMSKHQVCVTFFSESYCWMDTIGDQLLLTKGEDENLLYNAQEVFPSLLSMTSNVSIYSFQARKARIV